MKYFLYDNEGNVKAISEGKIIFDKNIFTLKGFNPTETETELIKQGYKIKIRKGKLEFEKSQHILEKEERENVEIKKADLKNKINSAKDIGELKELIKNLI